MKKLVRWIILATLPAVVAPAATAFEPIRNQYIVVLSADAQGPVRDLARGLVASVGGGELLHVYDAALDGFAVKLPAVAARALERSPLVARVEQDTLMSLNATQFDVPSYGIDRVDQITGLDGNYDYPAGAGAGAHVYIIDTGLNTSHVDFAGRIGPGANFASNGGGLLCTLLGIGCPAADPSNVEDCNGHGTHVSGTAVGTDYGIAKSATVHAVRVFSCGGTTATSTIIAGVDWVTANAILPAVANMSLGGGASATLDNAVQAMIDAGVTAVVAAGNDDADACSQSPARLPDAITVGSTTSSDARSSFSNFGTCVDIFAPGSSIVSASSSNDTGSTTLSGTSMASPHVAGGVARYLMDNGSATPANAAAALIGTASTGLISDAGTGSPNRLMYLDPAGF
ncbi:MAG: S8 family peptidase [Abyssibacter sp.]|nr:S8 family peptidase [Abyssibacter sp.]MCK5857746.1 S8 family peptidase [Abyssibacter sp.]